MQVITVCVPSAHLSSALCEAFKKFGIAARASAKPIINGSPAERLACPIEPVDKHDIWIAIQDGTPVQVFLERTFLDINFVTALMPQAKTEDDRLAIECIMTAATARTLTLGFKARIAPHKLTRSAKSQGSKPALRLIAESLLGVPNLSNLLVDYVDQMVASTPAGAQIH
ncbi:hypothetical protein [Paracidovorax wautersii]|uniref:Uncharacterized protein n=1 Tax=Paracidovorax wautersii TaxID=1177982 RepID=A0A1I2HXB0_9BURK|nr:hypothetical protein [Paracidovorax wautersii]SFF33266.1 hypothetical protein SAMN04489711_1346 [Paracidovorax wautersii]